MVFSQYALGLRSLWVVGGLFVATFFYGLLCTYGSARRLRLAYQRGDRSLVQHVLNDETQRRFESSSCRHALAWAGLGEFAAARRHLVGQHAESTRQSAELQLCTLILIAAFEGKSEESLCLCRTLLMLRSADCEERDSRAVARADGLVSIARVLSGIVDDEDFTALSRASSCEPMLYWPCRYSAAVGLCLRARPGVALSLLERAPRWPAESSFYGLHQRLFRLSKEQSWRAPSC